MYLLAQSLFVAYYQEYNIPFGKKDVDNYLKALEGGLFEAKEDTFVVRYGLYGVDTMHFGFQVIVRGLSWLSGVDAGLVLTYLIPYLVCLVVPVSLLVFTVNFLGNVSEGVYAALLVLFGSLCCFFSG